MAIAIGNVGDRLVIAERARIIAEAAALAGVHGGARAAETVAHRNAGALVDVADTRDTDGRFTATASFGDHRATANAADSWAPSTPTLEP
jgi:hypothetical protein